MSRPEDIPQDVWEAAGLQLIGRPHLERTDQDWIARAIIAERQRCAKVAVDEIERAREFGPHHIPVLSSVARAIRTGAAHG